MWFKNLRVYRLTKTIDLSAENLESKLSEHGFQPCSSLEYSRYGWVPPMGKHSGMLTHVTNGNILLCARKQEKILPPAAINERVLEKVLELETNQGRNVYRKEKRDIKDDVIHTLLPRALTRSSQIYAYFIPKQKWLFIDAASAAKADEFLEHLRLTLGELPAIPLTCHGDPADIMTHWLKKDTPKGFELNNECDLRNPRESKNIIRCKNQELESDEIATHLKAGKRVIQLALNWREAIGFILAEDFSLKRLKFTGELKEEAQTEAEDFASQFDQDFAVMGLQLSSLMDELIEAFGGLEKAG